jgi:hypothetical protein
MRFIIVIAVLVVLGFVFNFIYTRKKKQRDKHDLIDKPNLHPCKKCGEVDCVCPKGGNGSA